VLRNIKHIKRKEGKVELKKRKFDRRKLRPLSRLDGIRGYCLWCGITHDLIPLTADGTVWQVCYRTGWGRELTQSEQDAIFKGRRAMMLPAWYALP